MCNLRVGCGGSGVVDETEPVPVGPSPLVQQALISAVPAPLSFLQLHELIELVFAWSYDQDSRVEDIGPSDVRNGSKLVRRREEMGYRQNRKDICVQENYLRVLSQSKYVELREDSVEIRTT